MLDARQADDLEAAPGAAADRPMTRRMFEVWLRWDGDERTLNRRAKPEALMEQFTMLDANSCADDAGLWRCVFEHRGRSINFDNQSLSLLRRLAPIAVWVRAERIEAPAPTAEGRLDTAWRDFGRRALP